VVASASKAGRLLARGRGLVAQVAARGRGAGACWTRAPEYARARAAPLPAHPTPPTRRLAPAGRCKAVSLEALPPALHAVDAAPLPAYAHKRAAPEGGSGSPPGCSPDAAGAERGKGQLHIQAVAAEQGLPRRAPAMDCAGVGVAGLGALNMAAMRSMPAGPGFPLGGQAPRDLNGWGYANLWAAGGGAPLLGGMPGMAGVHPHGLPGGGLGGPPALPDGHPYGLLPLLDGMGGMALSLPPPPPPPPQQQAQAVPGMRGHYITSSPDSKRPQATEINHNKAITKRLASAVHYQQVGPSPGPRARACGAESCSVPCLGCRTGRCHSARGA